MYSDEFEEAWRLYPRKINKALAYKKYQSALKRTDHETIRNGVIEYAGWCESTRTGKEFVCHFATWLGQDRFLNDYSADSRTINAERERASIGKSQTLMGISTAIKITETEKEAMGRNESGLALPF